MSRNSPIQPERLVSELRRLADEIESSDTPSVTMAHAKLSSLVQRLRPTLQRTPLREVRPNIHGSVNVADDRLFDTVMKRYASFKK